MEMSLRTALLYYNTLRYLKPCQIYGRVAHVTKAKTQRLLSPVFQLWYTRGATRSVGRIAPNPLAGWSFYSRDWLSEAAPRRFNVEAIRRGRFSLLNRTVTFAGPVEWNTHTLPKLWRYHLHYFDYLVDLARAYSQYSDTRYLDTLMNLVNDWIAANPLGCGDGWEPYPLSLRLVNWIKAAVLLAANGSVALQTQPSFHRKMLTSLYTQARFLERNLEYHLLGNHLIKNAKALLFAGLFFEGAAAERWRQRGEDLLESQLDEQVLPDGGHFERSPMYHAIVLEDLAESLSLVRPLSPSPARYAHWEKKVRHMARFLESILHPDNQIPLFNDSAFGMAADPAALVARVRRLYGDGSETGDPSMRLIAFPQTGYYVIQDHSGQNKMILDCGQLGPDYLPGHAHSDTLSYELSMAGERIVVDTGVYEYHAGALRHYSRSTRAHNTVMVDHLEQSEVWSSFRVARRARPTQTLIQDRGDYVLFAGSHDGYLKKAGVRPTRRVFFIEPDLWIVTDWLDGHGTHRVEGFIHLHPDITPSLHSIDDEVAEVRCVSPSGRRFAIRLFPPSRVDIEPAPYFPEFGKQVETKVVHYWLHGALPARLAYAIAPAERLDLKLQWLDTNLLSLSVNGERRLLSC